MRKLGIEIAGDYNSTAIREATAGVEQFGRTVNEAATKNVQRLAAQRIKLQELAGEYRLVAATAERGSAQQVAASRLAMQAEARLAGAVKARAAETAIADRQLMKFTRGAAEASGRFGKLGIGMALGSGGFLAGALSVGAIKSTIDAARELAKNQQQLEVSLENSGISWAKNRAQIERFLATEKKAAAFDDSDLIAPLGALARATGDVVKAERDVKLAADIARGAHISLGDATAKLVALEAGRTRGVQQLGIKLPIVKTAQDALTKSGLQFTAQQKAEAAQLDQVAAAHKAIILLQEKYAGSAKKYADSSASATERFDVAINSLQESIGTVLLPVVEQIAGPFAKWAQTEADSGDAARKTKDVVGALTGAFRTAKDVVEGVDKVTGSFKHTLELLLGLKLASVVGNWIGSFKNLGLVAKTAEGEVAAVRLALIGIPAVTTAVIIIEERHVIKKALKDASSVDTAGGPGDLLPIYSNGKWVDPITHKPVADQAYWNKHGRTDTPGQTSTSTQRDNHPGAQGAGRGGKGGVMGKSLRGEDPMIVAGLQALADAGYQVDVTSGVRSYAQQAALYARYVKSGFDRRYIAAKPGTSNHETGRAVDVYVNGKPVDQSPAALAILKKYGLVADVAGDHEHLDLVSGSSGTTIQDILNQGTKKPKKPITTRGSALIDSGLLDKITLDKNNASDSSGSVANMWLHRELADLQKARDQVAAKLKGASPKQKTAIDAELRSIDTQIAGVNKSIATNLKAQAQAIKSNAAAAISAAKSNIASAFSQIIDDARSAFDKETQDYIDTVLGPKFFQGTDAHGNRLQTASEKRLADMQAADTQQQLQDAIDAAKKQLADDTTGALLEHVVDITTGATKDIYGPAGTSAQRALDQKAIEAAQRAFDENTIAIDAAKERAQEDYDYAQAVKTYQRDRALAESSMVKSLNDLEKQVEQGKASFTDLQGVLASFGVSISDIPADQWSTDFAALGSAVQTLAKVMMDEAAALAKIGDPKDAAAVAAAAASIAWGTEVKSGQTSITSGLGGAGGMDLLNPYSGRSAGTRIVKLDTGADILRDGYAYLHAGERVQSAQVVRASGGGAGGSVIHVTVNAPNYVGTHDDLARAIKSPQMVETISTAVLMGNRRGHIRASQLN